MGNVSQEDVTGGVHVCVGRWCLARSPATLGEGGGSGEAARVEGGGPGVRWPRLVTSTGNSYLPSLSRGSSGGGQVSWCAGVCTHVMPGEPVVASYCLPGTTVWEVRFWLSISVPVYLTRY